MKRRRKIGLLERWIGGVQREMAAFWCKQTAAQGALQQFQPEQGIIVGAIRVGSCRIQPAGFDLADALDNQRIVMPVWPPVQRQRHDHCRPIIGGQQQAIPAKIIEADALLTNGSEQPAEAPPA